MLMMTGLALAAAISGSGQEYAPRPQDDNGPQRVSPRGSYSRSCSGDYVNRGRLYADCRDNRGQLRGTSIDLQRCADYDISNNNGLLVCGPYRGDYENNGGGNGGGWGGGNNGGGWGGGNNGGGWGNGGRGTITVYRDSNFRGASREFDGEVANLAWSGFNDQISSMRFRGEWEACTDANFRGTCRTFSDDVSNLERWGMNDRISSLRPVRRGGRW